jgi:hypothetical protein
MSLGPVVAAVPFALSTLVFAPASGTVRIASDRPSCSSGEDYEGDDRDEDQYEQEHYREAALQ